MGLSAEQVREYYEIPGEETSAGYYERSRVRELSRRILSMRDRDRTGSVHIITGRDTAQVRRIASLVAESMIQSGVEVLPSREITHPSEGYEQHGRYTAVLVDETRLASDSVEQNQDRSELISGTLRSLNERVHGKYAVILSLGQKLYESEFQDELEDYADDKPEAPARMGKERKSQQDLREGRYWIAFIPAALSFVISPITDSRNAGVGGYSFISALFVSSIALTVISIMILAQGGNSGFGKGRKIFFSGMGIFIFQALFPVLLSLFGLLPPYDSSSAITLPGVGRILTGSILFLIFQSIAAFSFVLIPFAYAGKPERAGLAVFFVLSEILLFSLASLADSYRFIALPPNSISTVPALLAGSPFVPPYNSVIFGLFYISVFSTTGLTVLSYICQIGYAATYLAIAFRVRSRISGEGNASSKAFPWSS